MKILLLASLFLVQAQDEITKTHIKLYKKISPAVVGVKGSGQIGTGVIVSSDGVILTSTTATGTKKDEKIEVILTGHKKVTGRVIYFDKKLELVVVRIPKDKITTHIEIGDSDQVKVGQVAYTLGDSNYSIFTDDQVAFSVGVISGVYKIDEPKGGTYKGTVFETSASVNPNQDGGALLDSKGKLVGMLTLSYHDARYAGLAIPVNLFKPALGRVIYGLELAESKEKVTVKNVEKDSPAEKAGFKQGDLITKIEEVEIKSIATFDKEMAKAGKKFSIEVEREDGENKVRSNINVDKGTISN